MTISESDRPNVDRFPSVTVVIPTFNEQDYIDACLRSVADQTYEGPIEVLVVDGGSEDRTREMAQSWSDKLNGIRVLDNPQRQQGTALNIGIGAAEGHIIVRLDAHATYAADYVERCVEALLRTEAIIVGGPMRAEGGSPFGEAVALATTTPMGVGPGRFHYSEAEEYVDTVFLGAYRREDIVALGGYDDRIRQAAEDHELSFRVTRSGGRILLDPTIRSTYHPRNTPTGLWRQYDNYGQGKVSTLMKHRALPTWRPLAPPLFVLGLMALPVMLVSRRTRNLALVSIAGYVGIVSTVAYTRSEGNVPLAARSSTAIAIMHVSYGLGFLRGLGREALAQLRCRKAA